MNALFLSNIYYESAVQLGDQHLARAFAEHGWRVAYIAAPISPFHLLSTNKGQLRERYNNYQKGGIHHKVGEGEIWSYVPGALVVPKDVPILNSKFVFENWHRFMVPALSKWLFDHEFSTIDLIYLRDPKQGQWLNQIPHRASIYRIADCDTGFKHFDSHNKRMEENLAGQVDLVAYTANTLQGYVENLHPKKTLYLPNGVDLSNFSQPDISMPVEYLGLGNPIVVFVGSINYWFDFDLLNNLTKALPRVNFVLIGPNEQNREQFVPKDNLHLLGRRTYDQIPRYLYHADIGIIPFNARDYPELIHAVNPLKLYEYAACGLPIVATRWEELEKIDPPASLCETQEDFVKAIETYLNHPIDPKQQMAFAAQHDWSNRFATLFGELEPLLKGSE